MMSEPIAANAAAFGALAVVTWFLVRHWMQSIEKKFDAILAEIKALCDANKEEHDEIWSRVNHHGHRVKACQANGGYETAGVIVEGK